MLSKRIIPCLDVRNAQTVKGINFLDIREVGDPVELGATYAKEGADELVYLDITATHENKKIFISLVQRIAEKLDIPFTVGGGINSIRDVDPLLSAGADKISINSAAVRDPGLITRIAKSYGSQFVVVAVDAMMVKKEWIIFINGGRIQTERKLYEWCREAEDRGAGEILFTSMKHDGTKNGFACETITKLSESLRIPVIASGGAGTPEHFREVFTTGKADAALAASIFHYREIRIPDLKAYLKEEGIPVRICNL